MAKPKKSVIKKPLEIVEVKKPELVLEGDPKTQLLFAKQAADALMSWVNQKPHKVLIRGKQFLEFGDWQILARFYGSTVSIDWTRPLERGGKVIGYEARAVVLRGNEIISSAEGMCTRDEKRWASADEYAIRSMAQTRTSAKALRNAFGWVAELAGYASTPAEEMGEQYDQTPIKDDAVPVVSYDDHEQLGETDSGVPTGASASYHSDIPKDVTEQRKMILRLLKMQGVDTKDGDACRRYVANETQLELVETNFPAIIRILDSK